MTFSEDWLPAKLRYSPSTFQLRPADRILLNGLPEHQAHRIAELLTSAYDTGLLHGAEEAATGGHTSEPR